MLDNRVEKSGGYLKDERVFSCNICAVRQLMQAPLSLLRTASQCSVVMLRFVSLDATSIAGISQLTTYIIKKNTNLC
jgi:hypothetical protein